MASKIRLQAATDDDLVEKCKEQTNCGDCTAPDWMTPSEDVRMIPPEDTVALVIDIGQNQGAIQIVEKQANKYVDMVGTEEAGNMVMIPWNKDWWFYCIGSTRVGYIRTKT
ncbi:MAG: hypothetical protein M4579_006738 [Chaenotheca gracillima]|nr:MAG: hypothetical protein M4579_006738 [Chaenotheca gracillima]